MININGDSNNPRIDFSTSIDQLMGNKQTTLKVKYNGQELGDKYALHIKKTGEPCNQGSAVELSSKYAGLTSFH